MSLRNRELFDVGCGFEVLLWGRYLDSCGLALAFVGFGYLPTLDLCSLV